MNFENKSQQLNDLNCHNLQEGENQAQSNMQLSTYLNNQLKKQPQDIDKESRLKSVQEMYEKLDDHLDNSISIKSLNGQVRISSNKLTGTKRNSELVISQDKDQILNSDDESENEETKVKRLVQNRKSAQKCRLKKKAEFQTLKEDVKRLNVENKELKEKLNQMTTMLYTQIEENQAMHKKMESNQSQHTVFLTKLLLNQQNKSAGQQNGGDNDIQNQLQSYLGCIEGQPTSGLTAQNYSTSFQSQLMNQLEEQMVENPQQQMMNALLTNISCNSTTANNASKSQSPITSTMFAPGKNTFQAGAFPLKNNNMSLPNSKKMNQSPDLYNQNSMTTNGFGQKVGGNTPISAHSPLLTSRQPSVSADNMNDTMGLSSQIQTLLQNQKQNPNVSIQDLVRKIQYQKIMTQKANQLGMKHAQ